MEIVFLSQFTQCTCGEILSTLRVRKFITFRTRSTCFTQSTGNYSFMDSYGELEQKIAIKMGYSYSTSLSYYYRGLCLALSH